MGSFYGRGGINGGSGTSDYNQLINVPIKNIGGETGVVNLALLQTGHYNLKGAYKVSTESSEEITNHSILDIIVLNDKVNNTHSIEFITAEEGELYFNLLTYNENNMLIKQDKRAMSSASAHPIWESIT